MKKILLTSVSGPLGTGVINAIRAMDEPWHIIGLDSNPVYFLMADVDERHLVPRIDHERFYDVVRQIITETQPDFFWPLHDNEMPTFAGMHDLGVPMFLPSPEAFEITQDKMAAYEHFKQNAVPVPDTMFVNTRDDLEVAMERFNGDVWLRAHRGAGGKGALRVSDINTAISWLDMNDGWGSFTASERITGADSVVETVWNRGELVFAQGRTRKRGTPGNLREPRRYRRASTVGAPPEVNDVGLKAIRSVMAKPHGIFFADQKIDSNGLPRVTEVNTGRFSSNGSIYWFDKGPNLAEIVIKLGMGQMLDINVPLINPLPEDLYRLSGDDIPFKYVRQDATRPLEAELEQRLSRL